MSADQFHPPVPESGRVVYAPTIAIETQVRVPDVSYYQDAINFEQMAVAGAPGVFIRAGQRNWVDTKFFVNWAAAKLAGLLRGTYWLYDSREDPKKQAALWASLIQGDTGEMLHIADLEENYGGPYGTKAHFKVFLQEFERLSGLPRYRIGIYTAYYWWLERVGNDPFFAVYALWLAWYNVMSVVKVPVPWVEGDLVFWQDTSHGDGTLYGVSSLNIDLNWFCCSVVEFWNRFDFGGGTGMATYSGFCKNQGAKVWNVIGGTVIKNLALNQAIKGDLIQGDYMHLTFPVSGWAKKADLTYTQDTVPGASPSSSPSPSPSASPSAGPVEAGDVPYTIILGDDITYEKVTITGTLKAIP